ncbi:hypothetical protein [Corallococcus exiguus]|uniref:Uncharacterized protein n=1 Tax=Corallococcus exiguus TaxID=83462 RepID=A0A7X4Y950_9BACT|nr:hypothetical protein [Corallococcus exiguus]NBC41178.1 hypothetical protein [Corallococcus exiguus]TNV56514.1 hypothetical protein FH620_30095 [Corallococcus exiguus]
MHRLIVLAVLLCVACGDKPLPPPDAGTESPPTFVVHSDWWDFVPYPDSPDWAITVLLGDGSRFRQPLGRDGIARFHDAAITGPQDITFVVVSEGSVTVGTTLAVEGPEVWVRSGFALIGGGLPDNRQATLTGRVTNQPGNSTTVNVVGKGFAGKTRANGDGTFRVDALGKDAGRVSLFARDPAGDGRVGMVRDVAVGWELVLSDLVIPLDHPLDQRHPLEVTRLQPYGAVTNVFTVFTLGSEPLFSMQQQGAAPTEIRTMARTPPFDTVDVQAVVMAGDSEWIAGGQVRARTPLSHEGVTSLALPEPAMLTSPEPGPWYRPGVWPRSGLTLRWSADPMADIVTMRWMSQEATPQFLWFFTAPAASSGFTPFKLPAEVSPTRELPPGRHSVQWFSRSLGAGLGYQDFFKKEAPSLEAPDSWVTDAYGGVILQD